MRKRYNKEPSLNVRFPLVKNCFTIKEFISDIYNIYVSTFGIFQNAWFLWYRWKIYPTLYARFYTILGLYIHRLLLLNEGRVQYSMLSHPFLTRFQLTHIDE